MALEAEKEEKEVKEEGNETVGDYGDGASEGDEQI